MNDLKNEQITISLERKLYLKKVRIKKILVLSTQIILLIGFLILWEMLANYGIIDSFITSKPSRIFQTFMNLTSNDLLKHIYVTTFETVVGFLIGISLGLLIAIILWWSDFLSKVAEPYLVVLNSLPKVALRTSNYYLGWCRHKCNNSDGCSNFFDSNNTREFKWFYKN